MAGKNSVYDFLYVDWKRISSLTSQMDEMGVLKEISETHSKDVTTTGAIGGKLDGSVGADGTKAGIEAQASTGKNKNYGKTHARSFDAMFALPINFLDLLEENELIHKSQEDWAGGRIALFKGALTIADMTAILPAFAQGANGDAEMVLGATILNEMPPNVQGVLVKGGTKIWSVYDLENWVTHPASLSMSHGARIDGQWAIIGIVDAKPNDNPTKAKSSLFAPSTSSAVEFSELLRTEFGRPKNCYGFTPLLVFRQVS